MFMRLLENSFATEETAAGDRWIRWTPPLALAALVVGALLPEDGWGLPVCWFKGWSGYPCLSCGLTRSFLHTVHGDLPRAFELHPLGPPLVGLCLFAAVMPVTPAAVRHWWVRCLAGHRKWIVQAALAVVAILILNGAYRLWWIVGLHRPSLW